MEILSVAAKGRLHVWIMYVLIFCAVVMGGFGVSSFVLYQKQKVETALKEKERAKLETRVALVEEANKTTQAAVAAVESANKLSDTLIQNMQSNIGTLQKNDRQINDQLASVRATNEAARKYLATAVPESVGCVLDQTCIANAGEVSEAKRSLDDAMHEARSKAKPNN